MTLEHDMGLPAGIFGRLLGRKVAADKCQLLGEIGDEMSGRNGEGA